MSNLLDKSSLVLTPTAYKNGKILSVKPAPSLGSELVVNGDFATDLSGWNVTDGAAGIEITWTANGVSFITDGAGGGIQQSVMTVGKSYLIEFDYTAVSGAIKMLPYFTDISETKRYSGYFVATTANIAFYRKVGGTEGIIDNVSVKEAIDGDFDFTRNSSATRVNSQGLIEDVQILSSNLVSNGDFSQEGSEEVTNGDFATDSNWNKGANWSILNGVATSNGSGLIQQSTSELTSGKTYKISFEITEYTSGGVKLYSGSGSDASTYKNTVGTHTDTLVLNGSTTSLYSNNFIGSIDNVSVKEVGQDWTISSSASVGENKLNVDASAFDFFAIQTALTNGLTYKVTLDAEVTTGDILLYTGTQFATINSSDSYAFYITSDSAQIRFRSGGSGFIGSITNIKIIEITSDTNLPRIDYTGGVGHWLFETQSTNLITYSSDFTQSYWRKDKLTVTANSIIAPSGELDASLIQETVYTSGIPSFDLLSSITLSAGTYTYTFYVKNNNGRYLGISFGSNSQRVRTNFDFNTNTFKTLIFNGTTTGSASFTALGDYYRISITATFPSSTAADTVIMPLATDTYPFYAFQNSDNRSFYLWGAQVEQQSFATSYIPTNGEANGVTRLQDAAFGAGSSDLINSTGVLYAEIAALSENYTGRRFITLNDATASNGVVLRYEASGVIVARYQIGGIAQCSIAFASTITNYHKIAFKYSSNDFALWVDGIKVGVDSSGSVLSEGVLNNIDFNSGNGTFPFYGKTKCVAVFKEALTDAELTCLTTI